MKSLSAHVLKVKQVAYACVIERGMTLVTLNLKNGLVIFADCHSFDTVT